MKLTFLITFLLFLHQVYPDPIPSQTEAVSLIVFQGSLKTSGVTDASTGITSQVSSSVKDDGLNSWKLTFPKGIALTSGLKLKLAKPLDADTVSSVNFNFFAGTTADPSFKLCLTNETGLESCTDDFLNSFTLASNDFTYVYLSLKNSISFKGDSIVSLQIHPLKNTVEQTIYLSNFYFHKVCPTAPTTQAASSGKSANQKANEAVCKGNLTKAVVSKGSIPTALPNRFLIGQSSSGNVLSNPTTLGLNWDVQYMYFTYGWHNNWNRETEANWGGFATRFFNVVKTNGMIPAVDYYFMNGVALPNDTNGEKYFLTKMQTVSIMTLYYKAFYVLMQKIQAFDDPVIVLLEADGFAFMRKQALAKYPNKDPEDVYVSVADTGLSYLKGLPNTLAGFGQALIKIRTYAKATNAIMGPHISWWGGSVQNWIDFLTPMNLDDYDFVADNPSDRDAGYYELEKGSDVWWNTSDYADVSDSGSYNGYAYKLKQFNQKTGKKWVLWQIPEGNSNGRATKFKTGECYLKGYKDNHAEYFFGDDGKGLCHIKKYAEAGVIALLFGSSGVGGCANLGNDYYTDGRLFMRTRVVENYYNLFTSGTRGVTLDRNGN